jgi:hypothetical protein
MLKDFTYRGVMIFPPTVLENPYLKKKQIESA